MDGIAKSEFDKAYPLEVFGESLPVIEHELFCLDGELFVE